MSNLKKIGVVIGRFQTDQLHEAHIQLINNVKSRHAHVLVLLGVRNSPPTKTNPLPYVVRERLVRSMFKDVTVLPLNDCRTDEEWSKNVDKAITSAFGYCEAILYAGRDGCLSHYSGVHETQELFFDAGDISASQIREVIGTRVVNDYRFRRGIIYTMENLPYRLYLTVDVALFKENGKYVLLCNRHNEIGYRLPGGHVGELETLEQAAVRELHEETGATLSSGLQSLKYLNSFIVSDWRVRNVKGVNYLTTLWSGNYSFGEIKASDDVDGCLWVVVDSLKEESLVEEHRIFLEAIKEESLSLRKGI